MPLLALERMSAAPPLSPLGCPEPCCPRPKESHKIAPRVISKVSRMLAIPSKSMSTRLEGRPVQSNSKFSQGGTHMILQYEYKGLSRVSLGFCPLFPLQLPIPRAFLPLAILRILLPVHRRLADFAGFVPPSIFPRYPGLNRAAVTR